MMPSPTSKNSYVQYALSIIETICGKFGPRFAGSEAETKTTEFLKKELTPMCDEILQDQFSVYPTFYPHGFLRISVFFIFTSMVCSLFLPLLQWIALGLILLAFGVIFVSLFLMKLWFAHGFPQATSHNIIGKISSKNDTKPAGRAKYRVIIAGHTDSAKEMSIARYGHKYLLLGVTYLGMYFLLLLIKLLMQGFPQVYGSLMLFQGKLVHFTYLDLAFCLISLVGLPIFLKLILGILSGDPVLGANDNLSGVGIAMALAKYFAEPEHHLSNIDLLVGSFGSEECGERGSHHFVKTHIQSNDLDNVLVIVPESVGGGKDICIISHEKMHFARHNPLLCNLIQGEGEKFLREDPQFAEYSCTVKALPFAASDAGRFAHVGAKSAMIISFDATQKPPNYHSHTDRPEALDPQTMEMVFQILQRTLVKLEESTVDWGSNIH